MPVIENNQLTGTWRSYKYLYNGREIIQDAGNWTEWTFHMGGNARYRFSRNNEQIEDHTERLWIILEKETAGGISSLLCINKQPEYEILSADNNFLVLKSNSGIIFHLAAMEKWNELKGL